ncbi:MAG: class I SAM-dependent methyltransferase [Nocardioidaceae bacterium]|nr:class I SAM-dependent methyltransferase [Nocardioidaceae bacterium]MCL2613018.1 class I SAM-dependent methyltransferase [Nocardioidaceae bacterium]
MSHPPQQDVYGFDRRPEVAPYVPRSARSVLEIGCGRGGFARTLRELLGPDARLVGVEPVAESAAAARAAGDLDEVVEGFFPEAVPEERFDLVVVNDVLEHMLDPWAALRSCHRFLAPGGRVVASLPSIQYAPVVWQLLRGRWDYTDDGTLDRTHVRFFTRATMVELFETTGYDVERTAGIASVVDRWATDPLAPRRWLKRGLARALGDAAYCQFVVVAGPR